MKINDNCLERASIAELREFILYGTECTEQDTGSYEERLSKAHRSIESWLESIYPEAEERESAETVIYTYATTLEEVYMEIGLRAGMRLMGQVWQ